MTPRTQSDICRICCQYTIGRIDPAGRCDACQAEDRKPQGQQVRLFEPAPEPMRGQVRMVEIDDRLAEMRAQLDRMTP